MPPQLPEHCHPVDMSPEGFALHMLNRGATERRAQTDRLINRIDDARIEANLTKKDLAELAGMEPATVRRILSLTISNPTLDSILRLAIALGHTLHLEVEPGSDFDEMLMRRKAFGTESNLDL